MKNNNHVFENGFGGCNNNRVKGGFLSTPPGMPVSTQGVHGDDRTLAGYSCHRKSLRRFTFRDKISAVVKTVRDPQCRKDQSAFTTV